MDIGGQEDKVRAEIVGNKDLHVYILRFFARYFLLVGGGWGKISERYGSLYIT